MDDKDKLMYKLRFANVIHGIIAFASTLYWFVNLRDLTDGKMNSVFEILMMAFTTNFLLWKLLFLQFHGLLNMDTLFYHSVMLSNYLATAYLQRNYWALALSVLPEELCNILMGMKDLLSLNGWRYTKTSYLNDCLYCFVSALCRLFLIPSGYYWIWNAYSINPIVLTTFPLLCMMQLDFVFQIPSIIMTRLSENHKIRQ